MVRDKDRSQTQELCSYIGEYGYADRGWCILIAAVIATISVVVNR